MEKTFIKSLLLLMAIALSVPSHAQKMVFSEPDKNNQKVIKRYNCYYHRGFSPHTSGIPIGYTAVFGVRKNSIMSTDDVEVNVVKKWVQNAAINDMEDRMYFIEIKNKSDHTLYIDKSHCYRVYHNGTKYCYFDPERDAARSVQRIIAIPPHKKKNLSDYHAELIKKEKYSELKIIDYPEDFHWDARTAKVCEGFLSADEVRSFTENASPYYRTFVISYSKDEDFSTYSLLTINFYMRQLIGRYYPELYRDNDVFDRFGGDQYTITNCEYGYGGVNRFRRF
jgi:hypothetical protein